MKRMTRRQVQAWLAPIRKAFNEMKNGEVDCIRGYAVTRLSWSDEYERMDWCIAGVRGLINRIDPSIDCGPLQRLEVCLDKGVPIFPHEVDLALTLLNKCEDKLIKFPLSVIKSSVLTEQIAIELDAKRVKHAHDRHCFYDC